MLFEKIFWEVQSWRSNSGRSGWFNKIFGSETNCKPEYNLRAIQPSIQFIWYTTIVGVLENVNSKVTEPETAIPISLFFNFF